MDKWRQVNDTTFLIRNMTSIDLNGPISIYIKIQPNSMYPSARLQKITAEFVGFSSPVPRAVVSFAAVFWDVTGERCVTSQKTAAKETSFRVDGKHFETMTSIT